MMTARRLLRWADLDDRRRRAGRGPLGRMSPWLVSLLCGAGFAAEVHRRLGGFGEALAGGASPGRTLGLWVAVTLGLHVVVLFGSPHRLYWRRDSALLSRLPIPGGALFRLALYRSARAAARAAIPCAAAALAFAPVLGWDTVLRLELLVAVAAAGAGLLGPSAALAAGAVVASDRAQAMLGEMAGEFHAPKTSWLGVLPGVAGTALVVVVVLLSSWASGAEAGAGRLPLVVAALALPVAAAGWAILAAARVMPAALREVSALDQERLAHIERSTASGLERRFAALVLRDRGARLVADKDAALARRRYPSPYFLGPLGVIVLWLIAAFGDEGALSWGAAVLLGLGAYAALMGRRLGAPPVEIPRLLATLPVAPAAARRAKRAAVALRALTWIGLGGVPLALAQADQLAAAAVVALALALAWIGGAVALGLSDPT